MLDPLGMTFVTRARAAAAPGLALELRSAAAVETACPEPVLWGSTHSSVKDAGALQRSRLRKMAAVAPCKAGSGFEPKKFLYL